MRLTSGFVTLLMGTSLSSLAQPPQVGTWAIDYAKSDGSEQVWEFTNLGSGLWEFKSDGVLITHFRMDDEECTTCPNALFWELIGPDTYLTSFVGLWARDVVKIAPDGSRLSYIQKHPGAKGELEDRVGTFQRLSGGPGLAGTWRSKSERSVFPPFVELSRAVGEWFVFKRTRPGFPGGETVCVLLLDGADHPCFNAFARGRTIAMNLTDARTLKVVRKINGERAADWVYTVSPDGESMTQTQRSVTGGSIQTVYKRR